MLPPLTLLALLAAPGGSDDRFIHFLAGVPVGEVRMIRSGDHYTYLSQHFFRGGKRSVDRFVRAGAGQPRWASESLLVPRPVGCLAVEDELTRQRGEVCVTQAGPAAAGTLLGQPFTARYQGAALVELRVGDSRFTRREGDVQFADPFAEGLVLAGSGESLALSPPLTGARPATPKPAGENADCLAAAQAWVKQRAGYELVLGLLDDGERGWPHAWVRHRDSGEELDPSRPLDPRRATRYLALPIDQAARVYLELLGNRRTLRRVGSKPPVQRVTRVPERGGTFR